MEVHLGLTKEAYGGRYEVGGCVVVTMKLDAVVQTVDERFRQPAHRTHN